MPVKTKAKDHSKYMRTISHHNLSHLHHKKAPKNNWKKVLEWMGIVLLIAFICIGLGIGANM